MQTGSKHFYVDRVPGVCGGRAVIRGTRIPVWQIVECYRAGLTPEEILAHYPHLTLAKIFDALGYCDDNCDEIDNDLDDNRPPGALAE